jgi:hypothetical protein
MLCNVPSIAFIFGDLDISFRRTAYNSNALSVHCKERSEHPFSQKRLSNPIALLHVCRQIHTETALLLSNALSSAWGWGTKNSPFTAL